MTTKPKKPKSRGPKLVDKLRLSPEPSSLGKGKSTVGEIAPHTATAHRGPGRPKVKSRRPKLGGKVPKDHGTALKTQRAKHVKDSQVKKKSQTPMEQRKRKGS